MACNNLTNFNSISSYYANNVQSRFDGSIAYDYVSFFNTETMSTGDITLLVPSLIVIAFILNMTL